MPENTVEILIPVYNSEKYIKECIESILSQTYQEFKIIISDNCSSDKTIEAIESIKDSRIHVYRQNNNLGVHQNFNFLIQNSKADLVKLFCSDDVMLPWAIERQVNAMNTHPGVSVCSSDMIITDDNLNYISDAKFAQGILCQKSLLIKCLNSLSNNAGGPSNFLFRGQHLRMHRFDSSFKYISDLILAINVSKYGYFMNEGYPSYLYRRHKASDTSLNCPDHVQNNDWARFALMHGRDHLKSIVMASRLKIDESLRDELKRVLKSYKFSQRLSCLSFHIVNKLYLSLKC